MQIKERLDLTDVFTFTIDPEESTDLDDAISFEVIKSTSFEYYKIGVHISDVAEFVSRGDQVDKEARKKSVTFYKLGKIHQAMLPKDYTNNYLSLIPDRKRAVMSLIFLMDQEGNIVNDPAILDMANLKTNFELYQISQSMIKSKHKFSYSEAEILLNSKANSDFKSSILKTLYVLSQKIKEERFVRGGHLFMDENKRYDEYKSHDLIEQFMILANNTIARYLAQGAGHALVRAQAAPDLEELQNWHYRHISFEDYSFGLRRYLHSINRALVNPDGLPEKNFVSSFLK